MRPNGTFVVADAPNGRERIQIFTPAGFRAGGFCCPAEKQRVSLDNLVLNGIGSLQYTGTSILMSQPETGALITEYTLQGGANRLIGTLRKTGSRERRRLHLALNSGIPLVDPDGGFFFVFQTGVPVFQKYDRRGPAGLRAAYRGPRDRPAHREPADDLAAPQDERGRTAARDADRSHGGRRSAPDDSGLRS